MMGMGALLAATEHGISDALRRHQRWVPCLILIGLLIYSGCSPDNAGASQTESATCVLLSAHELSNEVRESSGIAVGHVRESRLWTHNDRGNDAVLYGLDVTGEIHARVEIENAENVDWEDVDVGACPGGSCIYIGDIGDNDAEREYVSIYRILEPALDDVERMEAERLDLRYADGPVDAESIAVADDGSIIIMTKGRVGDVRYYQTPPAPTFGGPMMELEPQGRLLPPPRDRDDRATGAAFSPDGSTLYLRTYRRIYRYAWPAMSVVSPEDGFDIEDLDEPQGEGIDVLPDGTIVLTSEGGRGQPPVMRFIQCDR